MCINVISINVAKYQEDFSLFRAFNFILFQATDFDYILRFQYLCVFWGNKFWLV